MLVLQLHVGPGLPLVSRELDDQSTTWASLFVLGVFGTHVSMEESCLTSIGCC